MLSVIKTAIITIIISFISGVLLDNYKNFAPRILCSLGKAKVKRLNDKKIKIYPLRIKNTSKKTIHELNINLQGQCDKIFIRDEGITNGLKYDIDENNDITIPFLSKNDEFSAKICMEGTKDFKGRPTINIRSPEDFKRVDTGDISVKDMKNKTSDRSASDVFHKIFTNKKIIAVVLAVMILLLVGVFTIEHFNNTSEEPAKSSTTTDTVKSNTDKSAASTNKSNSTKTNKQENNPSSESSQNSNVDTNAAAQNKDGSSQESESNKSPEDSSKTNATENQPADLKQNPNDDDKATNNNDNSDSEKPKTDTTGNTNKQPTSTDNTTKQQS